MTRRGYISLKVLTRHGHSHVQWENKEVQFGGNSLKSASSMRTVVGLSDMSNTETKGKLSAAGLQLQNHFLLLKNVK